MKITLISSLFFIYTFAACSSNSETAEESLTSNTNVVSDSNDIANVEPIELTELRKDECIEISNDTYIIENMLGFIESESTPGQTLSVVMSEDQNFYLEIGTDKNGKEESWKINLDILNPFGLVIKLELTDANKDDFKDELVIWWSDMDANNGMSSGYEASHDGVIIFDVMQRTEILNFIYSSNNSTYNEGPNANTSDPNYHAKMAEDSEWTICSFSHDIKLVDGEIQLSNYYLQVEGIGECAPLKYAEGTYSYNVGDEIYRLKK